MLFTAGLFKRLRCFWTSSFCREALNLAAEDSEITLHKQKITAKDVHVVSLLKCPSPILLNATKTKHLGAKDGELA